MISGVIDTALSSILIGGHVVVDAVDSGPGDEDQRQVGLVLRGRQNGLQSGVQPRRRPQATRPPHLSRVAYPAVSTPLTRGDRR